jgi:hypothetical protein
MLKDSQVGTTKSKQAQKRPKVFGEFNENKIVFIENFVLRIVRFRKKMMVPRQSREPATSDLQFFEATTKPRKLLINSTQL